MIDIHAHIINDVDDGSSSIDASILLIKNEIENNVTDIICTPHYRIGMFETPLDKIENNFNLLKEKVKDLNINLYLGQEIYVRSYKLLKEALNNKKFNTMNKTKYLLLEFSYDHEIDISEIVYNLKVNNYKVIIAHVERYNYMTIEKIQELIELGAIIQMNASSVIGKDGFKIKRRCKRYIRNNLISIISSDIHESRSNYMLKAYNYIIKHYNEDVANKLFNENAKVFIKGKNDE